MRELQREALIPRTPTSPAYPRIPSPGAQTATSAPRVRGTHAGRTIADTGFFPGSIWLVADRERRLPGSLARACASASTPGYTLPEVESAARRWQGCFSHQPNCEPNCEPRRASRWTQLIFDPSQIGCIRAWDGLSRSNKPDHWRADNLNEHYLGIADNAVSRWLPGPGSHTDEPRSDVSCD